MDEFADVGASDVGVPVGVVGAGVTDTVDVVVRGGAGRTDRVTVTGGCGGSVMVTVTGCSGVGVGVEVDGAAGRVGVLPATSSAAASKPAARPASPVTTTEPQVGTVFDIRHPLVVPTRRYEV